MNSVRWLSGFAVAMLVGPVLGAEPQIKTIALPQVEVRSGPSDQYYATCILHAGDPVDVLDVENKDWLKIKPPIDSFDWVNAADVDVNADGKTATVKKATHLRRGSSLDPKKMNSNQLEDLAPGHVLALLGGPPQQEGREVLIRVNPPITDCRYIPINAVENAPGRGVGAGLTGNQTTIPPEFGGNASSPNMSAFGQPANLPGASIPSGAQANPYVAPPSIAQTNPYGAQQSFEPPNTQPNKSAWFGQKGQQRAEIGARQPTGQTVVPADYQPPYPQQQNQQGGDTRPNPQIVGTYPQDNLQKPYGQPPVNTGGARRAPAATYGPPAPTTYTNNGYTNNPYTVSPSPQALGDFSDDPVWLQAERFESPEVGDIDSAIRCYDEVGRTYGQKDPNLALRAMNRAQYLRNQISAGVAPQGPLTRSAKPTFGDTTTNVYSNSFGQQNLESQRRPVSTAETNVYAQPTGQFLPYEAPVTRPKSSQVEELAQPNAKLAKPLMAHEATNTTAQKVTCSGFLEKTSMDLNGKRFYRLIPDDKKIASVIYCTNEPGINLDDGVNRKVQLYGPFYLHKAVNQYYIEVLQMNILQ